MTTIEFDVVNTHPNTLTSVSIRPRAEGIEFSPVEYFIGSMDHDELFTVEFETRVVSDNVSNRQDLTLLAQYRSGVNQHETSLNDLSLSIVTEKPDSGIGFASISVLFAILVISSLVMYRRKKQQH